MQMDAFCCSRGFPVPGLNCWNVGFHSFWKNLKIFNLFPHISTIFIYFHIFSILFCRYFIDELSFIFALSGPVLTSSNEVCGEHVARRFGDTIYQNQRTYWQTFRILVAVQEIGFDWG